MEEPPATHSQGPPPHANRCREQVCPRALREGERGTQGRAGGGLWGLCSLSRLKMLLFHLRMKTCAHSLNTWYWASTEQPEQVAGKQTIAVALQGAQKMNSEADRSLRKDWERKSLTASGSGGDI